MFAPFYPGHADVRFSIDTVVTAGQVVMLDANKAGKVKVSDGSAVYGFSAETNKDFADGYTDYRTPFKPTPDVGEVIGIWRGPGSTYKTDLFVTGEGITYAPGDKLYATNAGKITKVQNATVSDTAGKVQVGIVREVTSGGVLIFDSII